MKYKVTLVMQFPLEVASEVEIIKRIKKIRMHWPDKLLGKMPKLNYIAKEVKHDDFV